MGEGDEVFQPTSPLCCDLKILGATLTCEPEKSLAELGLLWPKQEAPAL